jgi:hypothetical protein
VSLERDGYDGPITFCCDECGEVEETHCAVWSGALDEAHSALAGCLYVLGDVANISHALRMLKTAQGSLGDTYDGHGIGA